RHQSSEGGRHPDRARLGRRGGRRRRSTHRGRDRLSRPDQGDGWGGGGGAGKEGGEERRRSAARAGDRTRRGEERVRQRPGLHGEISPEAAPYRDPGAGRRRRQRRASGRARLLAEASTPEGLGGSRLAGAERGAARRDWRGGGPRR